MGTCFTKTRLQQFDDFFAGMEREMHLCAAECCSDDLSSINEVMACKERCEAPLMRAQKYVQSELERYQESLQRCVLSCQDDIKDKVTPNTSEVVYICSSFELLADESRDLSQAEKKITVIKIEQIHKITTMVTQYEDF